MILHSLDRHRDAGLLFLRVGLGLIMIAHGIPKLTGGAEVWTKVGGALAPLGVTFAPTFWGFMAMLSEVGGGALLALGLFFRPALILLLIPTMIVATITTYSKGFNAGWSHALSLGVVFASLVLIGPGRYSIDDWWTRSRSRSTSNAGSEF